MDDDVSSRSTSKYNEAMLQIQRLHDAWVACNNSSRNGDFNSWNWRLDVIWRELSIDAIRLDGDTLEKNEYFIKIKNFNQERLKSIEKLDLNSLYDILSSKEIFLRNLQEASGKGSKLKDTREDEFE